MSLYYERDAVTSLLGEGKLRLVCLTQRFPGKSRRRCRRLFVSRDDLPRGLSSLLGHAAVRECLILSTCLRFEIYAVLGEYTDALEVFDGYARREHGFSLEELADSIAILEGEDVVRHLFTVVCGLDSEILGEKQIVRQIKNAYGAALEAGATGSVLNRLFQKSLNVSKKVRTRTGIDRGASSAASLAVRRLSDLFENLPEKRILILGAGQMGKLAGVHLEAKGCGEILFTSRSLEHARATAAQCGAVAVPYDDFLEKLRKADVLVTATGAPHVILDFEDMEEALRKRRGRRLCIVDLAEPPDVDGRVKDLEEIIYITIGEVNRMASETRARRTAAARDARCMIDEAAAGFTRLPIRSGETAYSGR